MRLITTQQKPSDIVQKILMLMGNPYSLQDYPMFVDIFNDKSRDILLKSGRQVSKTVTLAAKELLTCYANPYYPIIYGNASSPQTTGFSKSKLDPFIIHSPLIKNYLLKSKHVVNNVFHKRFSNFSEIQLVYFSEDADRVRGRTGFEMHLDEIQDMLYDAIIDAQECLSAAATPKYVRAGTPKSVNNTIEFYWEESDKKEWIIKCEGCNKHNIPTVENIGKHGLICKKCGKPLQTRTGFWYPTYTKEGNKVPKVSAYHIPQIILPMHCENESKWNDLLDKLGNYPEYKFKNEVMGEAFGASESLVNEDLLRSICIPTLEMKIGRHQDNMFGGLYVTAGIDWGGGGIDQTSRTTLAIYSVNPHTNQMIKIYGKIYLTSDFDATVKDIARILASFQVNMCFGDAGGGLHALSQLKNLLPSMPIYPVMYSDANAPFSWNDASKKYIVNRTAMIDNFVLDMKNGRIKTMKWQEFEPFARDLLNVKEELTSGDKPKRVWRRYPTKPDDALHSMVFGWLAARVLLKDLKFY